MFVFYLFVLVLFSGGLLRFAVGRGLAFRFRLRRLVFVFYLLYLFDLVHFNDGLLCFAVGRGFAFRFRLRRFVVLFDDFVLIDDFVLFDNLVLVNDLVDFVNDFFILVVAAGRLLSGRGLAVDRRRCFFLAGGRLRFFLYRHLGDELVLALVALDLLAVHIFLDRYHRFAAGALLFEGD